MNFTLFSNKFTSISIGIIAIVYFWSCFNLKLWTKENILVHDRFQYYVYLPAFFIEKDLSLSFLDKPGKENYNTLYVNTAPNGNRITKMGIGVALLQAPFFVLAHYTSKIFNYTQDGFSPPYIFFLFVGVIFYSLTGLIFSAKILLNFFSELTTALTILLLGLGTNLLCYTTLEGLMGHAYNFFLISLFIFFSIRWHKGPTYFISVILGLVFGLIIAARPTNAIIILFPFFFNITNISDLQEKLKIIYENRKKILISLLFMIIAFSPQIIYWKYVTGDFLYYSYNEEGFFFNNPKIIEGLMGFRKGWLIYTPVMFFALTGLYFIYKYYFTLFWSIFIFLILNVYVIFSWWCWWYGGGFSARPMIDSYSLIAIPLAATINYSFKYKAGKFLIPVFGLLFISLNSFQTYQFKSTLLHYDSMTKEAYFAIFGKLRWPENYSELIKTPDYDNAHDFGKEYKTGN